MAPENAIFAFFCAGLVTTSAFSGLPALVGWRYTDAPTFFRMGLIVFGCILCALTVVYDCTTPGRMMSNFIGLSFLSHWIFLTPRSPLKGDLKGINPIVVGSLAVGGILALPCC